MQNKEKTSRNTKNIEKVKAIKEVLKKNILKQYTTRYKFCKANPSISNSKLTFLFGRNDKTMRLETLIEICDILELKINIE